MRIFATPYLTPCVRVAHKASTNICSERYEVIRFKKKLSDIRCLRTKRFILFDVYPTTDYESLVFVSPPNGKRATTRSIMCKKIGFFFFASY